MVTDADANLHSPVALELVYVFDQEALDRLPKTGPEWFSRRSALHRELGKAIKSEYYELPLGSILKVDILPDYHKAIAVLSYTDYSDTKALAVGNLSEFRKASIRLMYDRVDYSGTQ